MKIQLLGVTTLAALTLLSTGCSLINKKGKAKGAPADGQVHGVVPSTRQSMGKPYGMVYVPPGTFHMGPSDEDINYNFTARNKQVSIAGFWMDATEITNNEYRQFVWWTRDSLAAIELGYIKSSQNGDTAIDWKKAAGIKWTDRATLEKLTKLILAPDNRIYNRMEIDPDKIVYNVQGFDLKRSRASKRGKARDESGEKHRRFRDGFVGRHVAIAQAGTMHSF